jgi:hypothetical protein
MIVTSESKKEVDNRYEIAWELLDRLAWSEASRNLLESFCVKSH